MSKDMCRTEDIPCCAGILEYCINAAEFKFPDTDLLIYMYPPFIGPVFKEVADSMLRFQANTGHRVLIAYSCPVEELML